MKKPIYIRAKESFRFMNDGILFKIFEASIIQIIGVGPSTMSNTVYIKGDIIENGNVSIYPMVLNVPMKFIETCFDYIDTDEEPLIDIE